jgi:urease accessory protein
MWLRVFDASAAGDTALVARLDIELLAARETAELRAESQQMGASLVRAFAAFGLAPAPPLAYPAAFASACAGLGVEREAGLAAYLWAWIENQVLVAVKTVPLGQQAGQSLLVALHGPLARAVAEAAGLGDAQLGSAAIRFAVTSARHETQYSRLYRS